MRDIRSRTRDEIGRDGSMYAGPCGCCWFRGTDGAAAAAITTAKVASTAARTATTMRRILSPLRARMDVARRSLLASTAPGNPQWQLSDGETARRALTLARLEAEAADGDERGHRGPDRDRPQISRRPAR